MDSTLSLEVNASSCERTSAVKFHCKRAARSSGNSPNWISLLAMFGSPGMRFRITPRHDAERDVRAHAEYVRLLPAHAWGSDVEDVPEANGPATMTAAHPTTSLVTGRKLVDGADAGVLDGVCSGLCCCYCSSSSSLSLLAIATGDGGLPCPQKLIEKLRSCVRFASRRNVVR